MTPEELAALPRYDAQPGIGYFRGQSTADGHPMVMTYTNHPLDGVRELWFHVEIQSGQLALPLECVA